MLTFDLLVDVLPPGVMVQFGPAEREPVDYDDGFVLPAHTVKPLQTLHTHPNDAHLVFYEEPHVYTYRGVPTSSSVTGVAHQFEEPFVATAAIDAMKGSRSQAWPRLEYVLDATTQLHEWTPRVGLLATVGGKTVATLPPHTMDDAATLEDARAVLDAAVRTARTPIAEPPDIWAYERALSDEEITAKWRVNGTRASHLGTDRHYLAECLLNGLPHRWWEPDMQVLYAFCREHLVPRGIVAYNTEKEIVCEDADLAGSIDLILWDERRGVHHILDHKRTPKLIPQLRGYSRMRAPFTHLDDCKGAGYALQTSIYQYILERDYGMTIGDRVLLSLHADAPAHTSVPYLKAEVEYIMETRFALVRARRAARDADPTRFACARTGAPLVDAVRLADGTLVMEKIALVHGLDYEIDRDARAAFETAVEARREPVSPFDASARTSWKRQMPAGGIQPPFK